MRPPMERRESERLTESQEVGHVGVRGVDPILGPLTVTATPLVEGQNVVRLTHCSGKIVPGMRMSPQPVEQDDGRLADSAPIEIM